MSLLNLEDIQENAGWRASSTADEMIAYRDWGKEAMASSLSAVLPIGPPPYSTGKDMVALCNVGG